MSVPRRFYMRISQLGTHSKRNGRPLATFRSEATMAYSQTELTMPGLSEINDIFTLSKTIDAFPNEVRDIFNRNQIIDAFSGQSQRNLHPKQNHRCFSSKESAIFLCETRLSLLCNFLQV